MFINAEIRQLGFSRSNISSIGVGKEQHFELIESSLIRYADKIRELYAASFTAQNITTMLSGAGSNSSKAIAGLVSNNNMLIQLCQKKEFTPVVVKASNHKCKFQQSGLVLG